MNNSYFGKVVYSVSNIQQLTAKSILSNINYCCFVLGKHRSIV